jgi:hypothetical protein
VRVSEEHFPVGNGAVAGLPAPPSGAQSWLWWEDNTVAGPKACLCVDTDGTIVD